MPKTLKFRQALADLVLAGKKDTTWRLFDDKGLAAGDTVELLVWETLVKFADAKLVLVEEKEMGTLREADFEGHEKFADAAAMYRTYARYYDRPITAKTPVKVIRFRLLP